MGIFDSIRVYLDEAESQRERADELSESNDPEAKARGASLSRLADSNLESAHGAIRRELGLSNDMTAGINTPEEG